MDQHVPSKPAIDANAAAESLLLRGIACALKVFGIMCSSHAWYSTAALDTLLDY